MTFFGRISRKKEIMDSFPHTVASKNPLFMKHQAQMQVKTALLAARREQALPQNR